jgi:hypothetical protein
MSGDEINADMHVSESVEGAACKNPRLQPRRASIRCNPYFDCPSMEDV